MKIILLLVAVVIVLLTFKISKSEPFEINSENTLDPYLYWNVYKRKTLPGNAIYKDKECKASPSAGGCSETECRQKCLFKPKCQAYSYNTITGDCFFGEMTSLPGVTTGINRGNKGEGTVIHKNGVMNGGKYMNKVYAPDSLHCGLSCYRNNDCDYFTYNNLNGNCYLNTLDHKHHFNTGLKIQPLNGQKYD